jgi:hypothetical protein
MTVTAFPAGTFSRLSGDCPRKMSNLPIDKATKYRKIIYISSGWILLSCLLAVEKLVIRMDTGV